MAAMEIEAGDRVLEMGCGCGAVSFAAALRAENVHVRAVDSNARAVECTTLGANLNGLGSIDVVHSASGPLCDPATFDVVVANPPYYAGLRIARFFLQAGYDALRSGGRIYVVTKQPNWYEENMSDWFQDLTIGPSKEYWIAAGRR
jgi:16S rRNA (guanine1207-N2)-methyltransferase